MPSKKPPQASAGPRARNEFSLHLTDPRTSSTQSLVPSVSEFESRRKLLVVYIHGFYGNDQSFRSFPAYVHSLLKTLLADTHVINSKIYPRYKTYKAIEVARDNFSAWLEPHESSETDVILVGHSMGGLLAAEVVLIPNSKSKQQKTFKHRILGIIAMDAPFLGLHPGIVISGIASLFQPSSKSEEAHEADETQFGQDGVPNTSPPPSREHLSLPDPAVLSADSESSTLGLSSWQTNDPPFDPPYFNDMPFRERPFFQRLMHFTAKHRREGLFNAVGKHINSHLEFGGCLADYRGLSMRYTKLRALDNVDGNKLKLNSHPAGACDRVRFANYYTLSPGRPRDADEVSSDTVLQRDDPMPPPGPVSWTNMNHESEEHTASEPKDLRASVAGHSSDLEEREQASPPTSTPSGHSNNNSSLSTERLSLENLEPIPLGEDDAAFLKTPKLPVMEDADLPAIPDIPESPVLPDLENMTDKNARREAEKEATRAQKAYNQKIKDRSKAIKEREKLIKKRCKEADKKAQKEEKHRLKNEKRREAENSKGGPQKKPSDDDTGASLPEKDRKREKKLRKFCLLPGKHDGSVDEAWIQVYMEGMNEIEAHCGLFLPGPHYDKLVGDVGARIAAWVRDDGDTRPALSAA